MPKNRPLAQEFLEQNLHLDLEGKGMKPMEYNRNRHPFSSKIGELFKMDYSAISQIARRFEQKSKVNDEIKEKMQKMITALKEV